MTIIFLSNEQLVRYSKKYRTLSAHKLLELYRVLNNRYMKISDVDQCYQPIVKAIAKVTIEIEERIRK